MGIQLNLVELFMGSKTSYLRTEILENQPFSYLYLFFYLLKSIATLEKSLELENYLTITYLGQSSALFSFFLSS